MKFSHLVVIGGWKKNEKKVQNSGSDIDSTILMIKLYLNGQLKKNF